MTEATPLISSPCYSEHSSVWLKLEMNNLTGSHKDREGRAVIAAAIDSGFSTIGCATTGNYGVTLAYYAWQHHIKLYVWTTPAIPAETLQLIRNFGAKVIIEDTAFEKLIEISSNCLSAMGAMNANPKHCIHKINAHQGMAKELLDQLPSLSTLILPVNNGSLLLGLANSLPQNIKIYGATTTAAQATSIMSQSFAEGKLKIESTLEERNGGLLSITESELNQAHEQLLTSNIASEYSSASVIAALHKIKPDSQQSICCIITGSRNKYSQLSYLTPILESQP